MLLSRRRCKNRRCIIGYTHFDKVSGVNGVAIGAKGSELPIDEFVMTTNVAGTIGAYIVVPYACQLQSGYAEIASGALGTGVVLQLFANDTAGTALCTAISMGASAATAGSGTVTIGTLSTATITALSTVVVLATSATACTSTVTLVAKRV